MTTALIVLALLVLGVAIVVWAVRRKPGTPPAGPRETDTAWNDPVTPGQPQAPGDPFPPRDAPPIPPSQDPRP